MTYSSTGRKPIEYASKASHHHLVNDPAVQALLGNLEIPPAESLGGIASKAIPFAPITTTITDVFAIDGGYTEAAIVKGFPASKMHFFQFGAVHFSLDALSKLESSRHLNPDDVSRLKNIDRVKFALPTLNAKRKECDSLVDSIRLTLQEFLQMETLGESMSLLDTLSWFLFRKYKGRQRVDADAKYYLSSNPNVDEDKSGLDLCEKDMESGFKFTCPETGKPLYLIDVFRLHEVIDEQTGASGICGYVAGVIEHLILLHIIRNLIGFSQGLERSLLIIDRPTGFFGNTARLIMPMFDLMKWLFTNKQIYLAGLEKSGAFVEHANNIKDILPKSSFIILGNKHIYKYISAPQADYQRPYGITSYYGHKLIFKTAQGQMYVVSLPVEELKTDPELSDIPNVFEILTHVAQLKCDMYENALLPVALANRLVSLSAVPSSKILESFARSSVNGC